MIKQVGSISALTAEKAYEQIDVYQAAIDRDSADLKLLIHPRTDAVISASDQAAVRGWVNYFGAGYKKPLRAILDDINRALTRWVIKRYKRYKRYKRFNRSTFKARQWLREISERDPNFFYMWSLNVKP